MEDKILEKVDEKLKEIIETEINPNNLDYLYKLSKIKHMVKEDKEMNYGNGYGNSYGNYGNVLSSNYGNGGYGEYGRGRYGRRGVDAKYRGDEDLERMSGEYGRYQENRGRYGAGEETDKAFHYMVKALEDFVKTLYEEAETPQQRQMLSETLQRSMR